MNSVQFSKFIFTSPPLGTLRVVILRVVILRVVTLRVVTLRYDAVTNSHALKLS